MEPAEFDKFAEEYRALHACNIAVSGESPDYFADYKICDIAAEYRSSAGAQGPATILDFGAGIGTSVPFVAKHFPGATLTCLDVSEKSLAVGESRFPGLATFRHFDGVRVPFPDATFDVGFAACVFHHIEHDHHVRLLAELRRVVTADGIVVVYEHNPYNPLTVRAVRTCPFDGNARLISASVMRERMLQAGFREVKVRYRVFFPRALRRFRRLETQLDWLPLGAQYYSLGRP